MSERVLLLLPTTSYKARDFLDAAERLGVEVVVGSDHRQALADEVPGNTLDLDLSDTDRALECIVEAASAKPYHAVLGVDEETVVLAARTAAELGLRHNPASAVGATRDKLMLRRRLADAGLPGPRFERFSRDSPAAEIGRRIGYPLVIKPLSLSASRGVLRADDDEQLTAALRRVAAILDHGDAAKRGDVRHLLAESYLPGDEVAVEGLIDDGRLRVLALFDKPDPLVGPAFEETLFVTPSRHPFELQREVERQTEQGCRALGLVHGPVHAELRLNGGQAWLLEIAARTIGGLCSRALRFGVGVSLEELVLRHALGHDTGDLSRETRASGVMMIPVPRIGRLLAVDGLEEARATAGVEEVTLSTHVGAELAPPPEGNRYLGFIFARADHPADAERTLRNAHARIRLTID